MTLRPQVAPWTREAPVGSGITGLWRPVAGSSGVTGLMALFVGDGNTVFTLHQQGSTLTGSVEGLGGGFFGGSDAGVPITDGKVEGSDVYFKAGNNTYSGTLAGDQIQLQRAIELGFSLSQPEEPAGPRPAVGPPPDGSDPSRGPYMRFPSSIPVVLHRVER